MNLFVKNYLFIETFYEKANFRHHGNLSQKKLVLVQKYKHKYVSLFNTDGQFFKINNLVINIYGRIQSRKMENR